MTKRDDARDATRRKILKLAKELFDEDGFEATTIRGIATRLDMSTGAIFANFASKEALYLAVMGHDVITPEAGSALRDTLSDLVEDLDRVLKDYDHSTGAVAVVKIRDLESLALARELVGIMEPKKAAAAA